MKGEVKAITSKAQAGIEHTTRRRRGGILLAAGVVAATLAMGTAPALAKGAARSATTSTATASSTSARFEAEQLVQKASTAADKTASGGKLARTASLSATPSVAPGVYLLEAGVRSANSARMDLTAGGQMVGTYTATSTWRTVSAVVRLAQGESVGTASATAVDVDWMQLTPATAIDTTRGNGILDSAGAARHYKGLNVPIFFSPAMVNGAFKITPLPVNDVWQWGADYVRLQLDQELWLADCPATLGAAATTYRGALQSTVNGLTARGITVLLSLSVTQRDTNTGCTPSSAPFAKEMADTRSIDFWSAVASAYKGNLLVQFDLFNEPNNVSDAVWRDGGAVSYSTTVNGVRQTMTFQTPGMQALYDSVRSAGATNLVFVAGGGWGTNVDALYRAPLDGYGIVGSTHVYCNNCTAENPHLPANLEVNNSARVLARYPVVMTESGWEQSQDGTFNKASLDWAEPHVDGWVMHMFYTGSFSLLQSWTTKLPNVKGIPVWNALQANRVARGFAAQPL